MFASLPSVSKRKCLLKEVSQRKAPGKAEVEEVTDSWQVPRWSKPSTEISQSLPAGNPCGGSLSLGPKGQQSQLRAFLITSDSASGEADSGG